MKYAKKVEGVKGCSHDGARHNLLFREDISRKHLGIVYS